MIIYFFAGLSFGGLGLAAYLQMRRGGYFPLRKELPWLAAFGFACATTAWIDMFLASSGMSSLNHFLSILRIVLQPLTGLLLIKLGWGILTSLGPLPSWTIFIPGVLIVPFAYVIAYASTTFITPSPIEIPVDIWSRYLLYLPGSIMAGIGFLRQWHTQAGRGLPDVATLMLGAGAAFLFEAFVVGLVVPAAPYGPASYYNYDRVVTNAFSGEGNAARGVFGLSAWLDYQQILEITHLPIEFWRMISAIAVTFFVVRSLDVFDAIQKRIVKALQDERDRAQRNAFEAQIAARETAESWTDALVDISRRISELDDVDTILIYIIESARHLLRSDFVGLAILNADTALLELKCFANGHHAEMVDSSVPVANPLILDTFHRAGSYYSQANEPADQLAHVCFFTAQPGRAAAIVRLTLDNRPIGAFWMARFNADLYSDTDLIWLECLADQITIAIKHGLATSQLQLLSVTEERTRIAREMHDGLAQVLGYLNLQVQTLDALLEQGKLDKLQEKLKQMHEAVKIAHADVRENILSLRTTLDDKKGLIPAVNEYLHEFGIQTMIDAEFVNEIVDEVNLPSLAEVQLVYILQEALSNVRKHAHSSHVTVRLFKTGNTREECINLQICDDGVGFVSSESKRSFGLQTMRERARSVNGELLVHSAIGKGTQIECRFPCVPPDKLLRKSTIFR